MAPIDSAMSGDDAARDATPASQTPPGALWMNPPAMASASGGRA